MQNSDKEKSIPDILIESAERSIRKCRQDILWYRERLKAEPSNLLWGTFLAHEKDDLQMLLEDLRELREFYGKENLIS